ncbi:hypothetical protein EX30DRAFT_346355 [Ascodesmis nigricans]|uniref:Uncharacterized protein n=1 Tax=Ascodesmis nigricans TaxID=341454 RepID=A0A4S2N3H2_9PEZI|nr:hypothetical protein EX30DRAFT_346355 [Ascodesmis nigricans]
MPLLPPESSRGTPGGNWAVTDEDVRVGMCRYDRKEGECVSTRLWIMSGRVQGLKGLNNEQQGARKRMEEGGEEKLKEAFKWWARWKKSDGEVKTIAEVRRENNLKGINEAPSQTGEVAASGLGGLGFIQKPEEKLPRHRRIEMVANRRARGRILTAPFESSRRLILGVHPTPSYKIACGFKLGQPILYTMHRVIYCRLHHQRSPYHRVWCDAGFCNRVLKCDSLPDAPKWFWAPSQLQWRGKTQPQLSFFRHCWARPSVVVCMNKCLLSQVCMFCSVLDFEAVLPTLVIDSLPMDLIPLTVLSDLAFTLVWHHHHHKQLN